MIRVAFPMLGGERWTGGAHYLRNLLAALRTHAAQELQPLLLLGSGRGPEELGALQVLQDLGPLELLRTPLVDGGARLPGALRALGLGASAELRRLLRQHRIDLVFESARYFGWGLGTPVLAWIPDLQHRVLPGYFSRAAWLRRELGFRAQLASRRSLLVSSEDTRRACERSYPGARGRVRALPFAVEPGPFVPFAEARRVADAYGLPASFFYVPNQLWRHKNHGLLLRALEHLREATSAQGAEVTLVLSGREEDPRAPSYAPALARAIDGAGLKPRLRRLGTIPYAHVRALLRACKAVVNPSLCEGWSTTVEEARAMGTPLLLSDLAVHREQVGEEARYFAVQGADAPSRRLLGGLGATGSWGDREPTVQAPGLDAAARGLAEALHTFPGDAGDAEREAKAAAAYERACERQAAYARGFVDVARWAIARTRSN